MAPRQRASDSRYSLRSKIAPNISIKKETKSPTKVVTPSTTPALPARYAGMYKLKPFKIICRRFDAAYRPNGMGAGNSNTYRGFTAVKSPIHGLGLFSINKIQKGEFIMEYAGEIMNKAGALKRQKKYWHGMQKKEIYIMKIGDNSFIDATVKGTCSRFINHSHAPNCVSDVVIKRGKPRVLISTLKCVNPFDELTMDYRQTSDTLESCTCGAARCTGFINCRMNVRKLQRACKRE